MVEENTKAVRPSFWRGKYVAPTVVLILICVGVFGWWGWSYFRTYVYTDDAMVNGFRSNVSSQVLGEIVDLRVRPGETVQAGEVVAVLDGSVQKAQLQVAEAELAESRVNVQLAQVEMERAQATVNSPNQQDEGGQKRYEEAVLAYRAALLHLASQEASVRLARAQLDQTVIRAAIDGQVAMRWLYEGDVVTPAQPIVAIYDMSQVWVIAYVEETKIANIRLGDRATISIDAYPGVSFTGEVIEIGAATGQLFSVIPPQNASGNFTKVTQRVPVQLTVHSPSAEGDRQVILRPGMSAEVKIKVR